MTAMSSLPQYYHHHRWKESSFNVSPLAAQQALPTAGDKINAVSAICCMSVELNLVMEGRCPRSVLSCLLLSPRFRHWPTHALTWSALIDLAPAQLQCGLDKLRFFDVEAILLRSTWYSCSVTQQCRIGQGHFEDRVGEPIFLLMAKEKRARYPSLFPLSCLPPSSWRRGGRTAMLSPLGTELYSCTIRHAVRAAYAPSRGLQLVRGSTDGTYY